MNVSHKFRKIAQPETYRRSWRKAQRLLHPIRLRPLLDPLDPAKLRAIQDRYRDSPEHYAKYVNVERWLKLNIERIQDLQLHRLGPQSVLDLGCGGGFFLFIARQFGHECLGTDIDIFPLFTELLELFGVPRKVWMIRAFERSPDFGRKFDLITGFSTAFNRFDLHDRSRWWGPNEWEFFLDDLVRHVNPGGRIFFGLNPNPSGAYYTPELRDFFLRRGAVVEREKILLHAPG